VLVLIPTVLEVTLTVIVQLLPAESRPLEKLTDDAPAPAVMVPSLQLWVAFGTAATVIPTGKTSVKARSVTVPPPVLSIVKVSVVVLPGPIVLGLNTLENPGCPFVLNTNTSNTHIVRNVFLVKSFIWEIFYNAEEFKNPCMNYFISTSDKNFQKNYVRYWEGESLKIEILRQIPCIKVK
jgi:hypothetical protein